MIRTVLGNIETVSGRILSHEHVQIISPELKNILGSSWVDEKDVEDRTVSLLSRMKEELDLELYVDGTPWDLGRDASLLARISERSGVHIVALSGAYYLKTPMCDGLSAERMAELYIRECKNGIYGTDIFPGMLKCSANGEHLASDEKKRISAIAIAQRETGLSMFVHSPHIGNINDEIIDLLEQYNADLEKIVIGHAGVRLDADHLEKILKRGLYVSFDQCFQGREVKAAMAAYELCSRGWQDKIVCSVDYSMYNDFDPNAKKKLKSDTDKHFENYSFLFNNLLHEFEKSGCTTEQCSAFVHDNPLKLLSI